MPAGGSLLGEVSGDGLVEGDMVGREAEEPQIPQPELVLPLQ